MTRIPTPTNGPGKPRKSTVQKVAKQKRLTELISNGVSIAAACKEVGITVRLYERWRSIDPVWAGQITALRHEVPRVKRTGGTYEVTGADFVRFRNTFFNHTTAPHHFLMIEAMERAKPGELTAILAWPGCGKSTLLCDWVNYHLALDPNQRIAIISEGQDLARKMLGQIANRMTDDARFPAYIAAYGPFRTPTGTGDKKYVGRETGKKWTSDMFQVFKSDHDEKEPSLECKGQGSALYGGRYDKMIYDDLQSTKNIGATDKILTWLRQDALTRPGFEGGAHTFIGSRVGHSDLYATMADSDMFDKIITIPALDRWLDRDDHFTVINGKPKLNQDCPAKPTWDMWSLADLMKRRHLVGEEIWTRTYMQQQFTPHDAAFTEEMLQGVKDPTRALGDEAGVYGIMTLDPALDTGICAYGVFGATSDKLIMRDMVTSTDTRRYEDIISMIASLAARYRPNVLVIEENNFQKGLLQDDRMLSLARQFGFRIMSHRTNRNKHDPVMGVAMMASAFVDQEIVLPWKGSKEHEIVGAYLDELRRWTPTKRGSQLKQDMVMASWFAWAHWEQVRRTVLTPTNVIRRDVPSWMRGNNRRGIA